MIKTLTDKKIRETLSEKQYANYTKIMESKNRDYIRLAKRIVRTQGNGENPSLIMQGVMNLFNDGFEVKYNKRFGLDYVKVMKTKNIIGFNSLALFSNLAQYRMDLFEKRGLNKIVKVSSIKEYDKEMDKISDYKRVSVVLGIDSDELVATPDGKYIVVDVDGKDVEVSVELARKVVRRNKKSGYFLSVPRWYAKKKDLI